MFSYYPKGSANDPEGYTLGVMAILKDYDDEVIERVTHPDTGMHRKVKWLPFPAEVEEACKSAKMTIAVERKLKAAGWDWNGERWVNEQDKQPLTT